MELSGQMVAQRLPLPRYRERYKLQHVWRERVQLSRRERVPSEDRSKAHRMHTTRTHLKWPAARNMHRKAKSVKNGAGPPPASSQQIYDCPGHDIANIVTKKGPQQQQWSCSTASTFSLHPSPPPKRHQSFPLRSTPHLAQAVRAATVARGGGNSTLGPFETPSVREETPLSPLLLPGASTSELMDEAEASAAMSATI